MDMTDWLLDADPAIRWQALRDVTDASADEVAAERARVATKGWGAELLALQAPDDGTWDGGTTICVLEGLAAWERSTGASSAQVGEARLRGEEYLLDRCLFRRRSDGQVIDPRFTMFSYPTRWYYDVLRALDYLRSRGAACDPRCAEAIDLVAGRSDEAGRWPLENVHQGPTLLEMEGPEGFPSRWNTLRAHRVLRWAGVDPDET